MVPVDCREQTGDGIMTKKEGGCLCGNVRYRVHSNPSRVTVCHCKFCQRATGGAYLLEPIFKAGDFSISKGKPKIYTHVSEGSGKQVFVHFCDNCGAKLFLTFERFSDVVGLYGGTFDDQNWYEMVPENSKHIFLGVARRGTVIPPGINTFAQHATQNDGTPIEPKVFAEPHIIDRP
jgi:hypothetical protein